MISLCLDFLLYQMEMTLLTPWYGHKGFLILEAGELALPIKHCANVGRDLKFLETSSAAGAHL